MNVLGIYGDIDYWGWGIISVDDDAPAAQPSYVACGIDSPSHKPGSGVFKKIAGVRGFLTDNIYGEHDVARVVMCTKSYSNAAQAAQNGVLVGFIGSVCAELGITDIFEGARSSASRAVADVADGTAEAITEAVITKLAIEDKVPVMAGQALATAYWSWAANKAGL